MAVSPGAEITIEKVRAAYEKIGAKPIKAHYLRVDMDGNMFCCPLSAVYMAECGRPFGEDDSRSWKEYELAYHVRRYFGPEYSEEFILGCDGEWSENKSMAYSRGAWIGRELGLL